VRAVALAAGLALEGCAAREETTPLGYVIAPSISPAAAHAAPPSRARDGGYSTPVPASDARK
jgi:hypothetical protein